MGVRPAVLMIIACLLLLPAAEAFAGRVACLRCHKPHYTGRGTCIGCHRGDGRSDRLAIAHRDLIQARFSWFAIAGSQPLQRGEKLLVSFACRRCHTSAGKGNRLASNLDRLPMNTTPQKIFEAIKSQALFMPDFSFDDRQITDLVNAILAGAVKAGRSGGETPQVVHFEDMKRHTDNVFEKQCGPCHKILTEAFGALGKGDMGPNLSGLFSEHYPATLKDNGRWTADILKKWLENPRKISKNSQMRPIPLKKDEFEQLLAILAVKTEH
ncbi:selenite/tellurite reduction operon c-type cytochrome lipoprotein ExtS [Geotalea uraniireducens]|nr:selenite/tellurite reduction operon c-type cytochrome lipoprotein ExtS [Geotalea uraniireducens]